MYKNNLSGILVKILVTTASKTHAGFPVES